MAEYGPRRRLVDLPLPAVFLLVAGLWIALHLILRTSPIDAIHVGGDVIGGLLFAAVTTAVLAAARRRLGGTTQRSSFVHALRTGNVPPDADIERWRDELHRLDHSRTRRVVVAIGFSLLPIALGIWGLAVPDARMLAAILLVAFVALDVIAVASLPLERRRAARLRTRLARST